MFDKIEKLGNSTVQHGRQSNRIYVLGYHETDSRKFIELLDNLAAEQGYDKIILKLPGKICESFLKAGYEQEARIIGFYPDGEACYFLSRFRTEKRKQSKNREKHREIVQSALARLPEDIRPLDNELRLIRLDENHAAAASDLYSQVFASYPFPITDPEYIRATMRTHVDYFGILQGRELAALASAEKDKAQKTAEMTDFAILPAWRGRQLARHLLLEMENQMRQEKYRTLYTIARAGSRPMNYTFAGADYNFGGTLVNNTQIAGKIESMNIWSKNID